MRGYIVDFAHPLPVPIIDFLNAISPPPRCHIIAFCLWQLDTEIERADNEVFGAVRRWKASDEYTRDYKLAKNAEHGAYIWPYLRYQRPQRQAPRRRA